MTWCSGPIFMRGEGAVLDTQILVMAKAPLPGFAKTRLCPPLEPDEAARLARAALADTLEAVAAARPARCLLALRGPEGPWCRPGFEVVSQHGSTLAQRLQDALNRAFGGCSLPILLVGMDTPQLRPAHLVHAAGALSGPADAVLGPATDGGYWCLGVREARRGLFEGVPTSSQVTGALQLSRLESLGLRCRLLSEMRDVDEFEDALAVAKLAPWTRFSVELRTLWELCVWQRAGATPGSS